MTQGPHISIFCTDNSNCPFGDRDNGPEAMTEVPGLNLSVEVLGRQS